MPAVVIAASNLLGSLSEHLSGEGELITFADTEPIQALQAILEQRPGLLVLERLFAATPRGAALINRIKTDPQLGHVEIRVMSHTGDYLRQIARAPTRPSSAAGQSADGDSAPDTVPAVPARPVGAPEVRRAVRHRIKSGIEIQIDGNPVSLVDISTLGAQVLSGTILRPNQKVRVTIPQDDTLVRCRGTVVWAKFELPKPAPPPLYRAGVEFLDVKAEFIEQFSTRHRL